MVEVVLLDINRLAKLIRLASSDNDHEALGALRRALKMVDNDLWGYIERSGRGGVSSTPESVHLRRDNQRLQRELDAARNSIQSLSRQLEDIRRKKLKSGVGLDLSSYMEKEGFFIIHYEVLLKQWIDSLGIKSSRDTNHWMAVSQIKDMFEKSIGDIKEPVSLKRFSQAFAFAIGKKAVKGGKTKDIMGFTITIHR